MPESLELKPKITVFGVGGAGGNAVNNMIAKSLEGADFVVANTDAQALAQSNAPKKVQLGARITEGLGAGARPEVGAAAAEESLEEILDHLAGSHMCFITAGMGGGTGTGAAPIIAQAARELGVLTVGVVTKPFQFEGASRMRKAEEGVAALQKVVDTLIVIPNQNLFRLANEKTTFTEAFSLADDVLYQGVKGVTDLMVRPGIINLDFADVRSVMDEMGKAMMGTGEASGENRAIQAAEKAIANPLLDEISLRGARGVLINITGSADLTLFELDEAANRIREEVDPDANIIVGSTLDPTMEGVLRVSVVATGIDVVEDQRATPVQRRPIMAEPIAEPARVATPVEPEEIIEEPVFEAEEPAYYPEPVAERPAPLQMSHEHAIQERSVPTAEQIRPVAQPSQETMLRLRAAVQNRPTAGAEQAVEQTAEVAAEKHPRFALNNLINRMTGAAPRDDRAPQRNQSAPRPAVPTATVSAPVAPQVTDHESYEDDERDRVEIPAFLRRQAN